MKQSRSFMLGLLAVLVVAGLGGTILLFNQTQAQQAANSADQAPETAVNNATILLQERFDAQPGLWSQFDLGALPEDQGIWQVQGGQMLMLPGAGDPLGETMLLAPSQDSARIIAAQVYPEGNYTVGLVFNYTAAGYDLFRVFNPALSNQARATLQHFDTSTNRYTLLAETRDAPGYALDTWQELRIEQADGRITALFNGQDLFSVAAELPASGQAGLYANAIGDVRFDNFVVAR